MTPIDHSASHDPLLNPHDIIEQMINLRLQISHLQQQTDALQQDFFAACFALNQDTITLKQAIIRRQLTRGQWDYPAHITEQELRIKFLKQQFQQDHEPISGRDITWVIRLLKRLA
ncbi:MAG: hypothetical protein F6K30_22765 [Cyanothece sp. SIO2G6]|nr:hypothetical protein [Cyanothece sp. SIO2G6]